MSERRLRRRRKAEKAFMSDSVDSDNPLQCGEKIPTNSDFQSASLSSDSGEHVIIKEKPKRRVLRRTNDFQDLKPSIQLDDTDSKINKSKVKKSKKTTYLPQICDVEEEYEIIETKMKNRKRQRENITSATVIKEDMSSTTSKSDTDASVPCESQLPSNDLEYKRKTKRKNQRRRNRKGKKVEFSSAICNNENESSVDTGASEVPSKTSDLSDSQEMGIRDLARKSTSDGVVYSFRNRKRVTLNESTVQNIVSPIETSEKSDDSVEYNYKRKRDKYIQKPTKLEEGKEFAVELNNTTTETRQQTDPKQHEAEIAGSKVEETFKSKSAYQSGIIDLKIKESLKSIVNNSPALYNSTATETIIVTSKMRKNKNKSVQFHQAEPSNTLCEDTNEKNNTYELDKSKNDISVLKTLTVESNESSKNGTGELNGSPNLKHRETDLEQNLSSFGVCSTPLPKREGTYTVLNTRSSNKKIHSTCKEAGLLTGDSSTKKPTTRIKMPNFALIHKKAFEKMEDIGQLQQRKVERAKLLLSGAKPTVGLQSPRKIQNNKFIKPLNFGPASPKYSEVGESPKPLCNKVFQNAVLNSHKPSQPSHQSVMYSGINESPKPLHSSQNNLINSPKTLRTNGPVFVNSPKFPKSNVQSPKCLRSPKIARSNLQSPMVRINTTSKLNRDTKAKSNKFKSTFLGKNLNYGTAMNIHKPVIREDTAKNISKMPSIGVTRYGFKVTSNPAKVITKQEQLQAVANKSNIVRNNVDERRNNIKGVRSNRRFDLLMQMRNKSKLNQ